MANGVIRNLDDFRDRSMKKRGMEWHFLRPCFKRGIMPSDIDGHVENNGRFLIFEEKQPGVEVEKGQWLSLQRMNKIHGVTVFIIWGDTSVPFVCGMEVWYPKKAPREYGEISPHQFPADIDLLKNKCKAWFDWAESQPAIRW